MKELVLTILAAMLVFSIVGIAFYKKNASEQRRTGHHCPVCDDDGCTNVEDKPRKPFQKQT
jgi:hypothetical protein